MKTEGEAGPRQDKRQNVKAREGGGAWWQRVCDQKSDGAIFQVKIFLGKESFLDKESFPDLFYFSR